MRILTLLAALLGLAMPAQAQDIPSGALALIERLEAARNAPQMMADGKSAPPKAALGLIGPAYPTAAGDKVEAPQPRDGSTTGFPSAAPPSSTATNTRSSSPPAGSPQPVPAHM